MFIFLISTFAFGRLLGYFILRILGFLKPLCLYLLVGNQVLYIGGYI
jgi:hypothetical protein